MLSTSRCTLSSVFGAAIRKIRLTFSPSNASKSTPSLMTIAARPGLLTASDLQCGMAIPSPIPVVPSSSLAYTPLRYFSTSLIFPLLAINATIASRVSFFPVTLPFKSILSTASKSLIFMLKSSLFYGAKCLLCLHSMCPCRSRGFYSLFCEAKCLLCLHSMCPCRSRGFYSSYLNMPLFLSKSAKTSGSVASSSENADALPVQTPIWKASL